METLSKQLLKKIRTKIEAQSTVEEFGKLHGVRVATMFDFLNGKVNIRTDTLMKILSPINMGIFDIPLENLVEINECFRKGYCMRVGGTYDGMEIYKMFREFGNNRFIAILNDGEKLKTEIW